MLRNKNGKKNKGFTLVEMLVSIAIFTVFMTVAVGALINIISENDRAETIKSVIDNVTLAVDNIARNVRGGTNYSCLNTSGNQIVPVLTGYTCSGVGVMYEDPTSGTYTKYWFEPAASIAVASSTGNIQKNTGCASNGGACTSGWQSITAPTANVNIANMVFTLYGDGSAAGGQPRLLITADGFIAASAATGATTTEFDVQTTASQRSRD